MNNNKFDELPENNNQKSETDPQLEAFYKDLMDEIARMQKENPELDNYINETEENPLIMADNAFNIHAYYESLKDNPDEERIKMKKHRRKKK